MMQLRTCFATSCLLSRGPRALERRRQRATSQYLDEMTTKVRRSALIADGPRGVDGEAGRALDQLRRHALSEQRAFGGRRSKRRRRDGRQRDSDVLAHAVRERQL